MYFQRKKMWSSKKYHYQIDGKNWKNNKKYLAYNVISDKVAFK